MRYKRFISILLTAIMTVSLVSTGVPAAASTVPSAWAIPEVNDANTSGLLTPNAARDYSRPLTRDEFCELVVKMAEGVMRKELPIPTVNPFSDSDSVYVQKANHYGIIYGIGDGKFDPNSNVQRQQLCAMMIRAITNLERDMGKDFLKNAVALPFKDTAQIDDYAVDSIKIAYANGIMKGDDQNYFSPKADITSQECVAVINRSFNSMRNELSTGKTEQQLVDMAYDELHIGFAFGDTEDGVTRDLLLTPDGVGNTAITWKSSNENAISSAGVVKTGAYPETVTLTASIKLGSISRDKIFTLKTSPYSGDRLLIENAYNELSIIYTSANDGANSVTSRLCLPNSILSLPVTWSSSNTSVITKNGQVILPTGSNVVTVTLTATIRGASESRIKTFELKVNNPAYTKLNVSLCGVALGMTQTQVAQILGAPKRNIAAGSNEIWNVYHDGYRNFVTVGFVGNTSIAVYALRSDAANQLKDASQTIITTAQANGLSGVAAASYTDPNSSNKVYAIMIYDPTSVIGKSRAINSDGQEQLLLELINAFRYSNNQASLSWNTKLGTSARSHAINMGQYNYFSVTSRDGRSFAERAVLQGYEEKLVANGNILGGENDFIELFNDMVNISTMRADILSNSNTVFGAGFASGYSGQYKTYFAYVFGTLKPITGITANPTSISVEITKTAKTTLTLTPTGFNETLTATSSNPNIATVVLSSNSVTVTGVAAGSTSISVVGNTSGTRISIPVTVGSGYATALALKNENTALGSTSKLLLGAGDLMQITATTTPATGVTVTWTSSNTNILKVSNTGVLTGVSDGTATVTASVQKNATEKITQSFMVQVATITMTEDGNQIAPGAVVYLTANISTPKIIKVIANPISGGVYTYANPTIAPGNAENVVNLVTAATATYEVSPSSSTSTGTVTYEVKITNSAATGTITRSFTIVVKPQEYATSLTLSPNTVTLEIGQTQTIIPTFTPNIIGNNKVTWVSNDPSIASVSNAGVITALKKGSTVITASMPKEGGGAVTDTVTVTVNDKTVLPNSVSITGGSTTAVVGTPMQLSAQVLPANTTDKTVVWNSDATAIATVNSSTGLVDFIAPGVVVITVTCNANPTLYATLTIVVSAAT